MRPSALSDHISTAALDFAWSQWGQMGVLTAPPGVSPWAQDPEALLLFTLEMARGEPRLFDEVLDWLLRNHAIVSTQRLHNLSDGADDARLVGGALGWVARQRRRDVPSSWETAAQSDASEPLFHGLSTAIRTPDAAFLAQGLLRAEVSPSGKSREPDPTLPINFALRLRHLLGVGARAEAVRYLLTADARAATVAAVASSAGYAKRNVQAALSSLHAAGAVSLIMVGADQRYGVDRGRWAQLLQLDPVDLPIHRDWVQLLSALCAIRRWLDRPELAESSEYMRSSRARDLLEKLRPTLAHAGVATSWSGGPMGWEDLVETIDATLLALTAGERNARTSAGFEVYVDANGRHRWRLDTPSGRILATSTESFASADAAGRAARAARALASSTSGS